MNATVRLKAVGKLLGRRIQSDLLAASDEMSHGEDKAVPSRFGCERLIRRLTGSPLGADTEVLGVGIVWPVEAEVRRVVGDGQAINRD